MNIVSNNYILKFFKKISIFKLDLGDNLKGAPGAKNTSDSILKIKDVFIKEYQNLNRNCFIRKYGEIGRLRFYEDGLIKSNEFHIYDGDKIYEITITDKDFLKEPGVYLTEILQMLENGEVNDENNKENIAFNVIKDVSYGTIPENVNRPDMRLPRDQYVESLLNRRRFLEKI